MSGLTVVTSSLGVCILIALLGWAGPSAADLRQTELRRLQDPVPAELRAERAGRIYIYEGLTGSDIARAMEEQFERVDSMMFIRVKREPQPAAPAGNGEAVESTSSASDGC